MLFTLYAYLGERYLLPGSRPILTSYPLEDLQYYLPVSFLPPYPRDLLSLEGALVDLFRRPLTLCSCGRDRATASQTLQATRATSRSALEPCRCTVQMIHAPLERFLRPTSSGSEIAPEGR